MQVNLGEKIRELRKRDSRTQDALANALGVTGQAVSRWEANGGFPDMEMIPAIANYFHITIDELFGYNSDREEKIKNIIADTDVMINAQEDVTHCVKILREAISEFPAEPKLFLQLGFALTRQGWQKHGARGLTTENCDYTQNDIEYNSKNEYWQEALALFERVLTMNIDSESRLAVLTVAINLYSSMGAYDKAENLAKKQDSVMICREVLLATASEGEKRDMYQGEALLALMRQIKNVMASAVTTKLSLCDNGGVGKFLDVAHLYESILDDGNCGFGHFDLSDLYIWSAILTARQGNLDSAIKYFDIGFEHAKKYEEIRNTGTYYYTAPLVSKVSFPSSNWPKFSKISIEALLNTAPENLIEAIRANSKYSELF